MAMSSQSMPISKLSALVASFSQLPALISTTILLLTAASAMVTPQLASPQLADVMTAEMELSEVTANCALQALEVAPPHAHSAQQADITLEHRQAAVSALLTVVPRRLVQLQSLIALAMLVQLVLLVDPATFAQLASMAVEATQPVQIAL